MTAEEKLAEAVCEDKTIRPSNPDKELVAAAFKELFDTDPEFFGLKKALDEDNRITPNEILTYHTNRLDTLYTSEGADLVVTSANAYMYQDGYTPKELPFLASSFQRFLTYAKKRERFSVVEIFAGRANKLFMLKRFMEKFFPNDYHRIDYFALDKEVSALQSDKVDALRGSLENFSFIEEDIFFPEYFTEDKRSADFVFCCFDNGTVQNFKAESLGKIFSSVSSMMQENSFGTFMFPVYAQVGAEPSRKALPTNWFGHDPRVYKEGYVSKHMYLVRTDLSDSINPRHLVFEESSDMIALVLEKGTNNFTLELCRRAITNYMYHPGMFLEIADRHFSRITYESIDLDSVIVSLSNAKRP